MANRIRGRDTEQVKRPSKFVCQIDIFTHKCGGLDARNIIRQSAGGISNRATVFPKVHAVLRQVGTPHNGEAVAKFYSRPAQSLYSPRYFRVITLSKRPPITQRHNEGLARDAPCSYIAFFPLPSCFLGAKPQIWFLKVVALLPRTHPLVLIG